MRALLLAAGVVALTGVGHAAAGAEDASSDVRESIARALDREASPWAATARSPEATITRVAAPSWLRGAIWRVERFMPTRPLIFYVAIGARGPSRLTGNPPAFDAWMRDEGVTVTSGEAAVALARLFVETTRNTGTRLQIADTVDALPLRAGSTEAEVAARARVREELAPKIRPPSAQRRPRGGWDVVASAVEGMQLVRLRLTVARNGETGMKSEVIRSDLPLAYAN